MGCCGFVVEVLICKVSKRVIFHFYILLQKQDGKSDGFNQPAYDVIIKVCYDDMIIKVQCIWWLLQIRFSITWGWYWWWILISCCAVLRDIWEMHKNRNAPKVHRKLSPAPFSPPLSFSLYPLPLLPSSPPVPLFSPPPPPLKRKVFLFTIFILFWFFTISFTQKHFP